jgi:putative SOS response-associated peptidase YedK
MCSNYRPVTRLDRLLSFFGVERGPDEPTPDEVFPLGMAPMIRLAQDGSGNRVADVAQFGLLPSFATELAYGRRTYNARSETVAKLASFRDAWKRGQRCIVPAEGIFEPNYESGRAVRWRIQQPGEVPMGVAGIWKNWTAPDGRKLVTFAMLTVTGAGHPVYQRMHKPGDEKRMVCILAPADYEAWLSCPVDEAPRFFRQWPGPLDAFADPLPPRVKKTKPEAIAPPFEDEPPLF